MKKLMKFELRQLFRMKSFYICLLISMAFTALSVIVNVFIAKETGTQQGSALAFDSLLSVVSNGQLEILLAVFVSLFICSDYMEGTIKNVISHGFSRGQVYFVKYIILILTGWIFAICDMVLSFVMMVAMRGVGTPSTNLLSVLLINFLIIVAFVSLFQFFAVFFRKNGGAIAVGIVFPLCLSIVITVFQALLRNTNLDLSMVSLSGCLSVLSGASVTVKQMGISILSGVAYILLFGIAGMFVIRRREL